MGFISSRFITAKAAFHHCTFSFITAHFVHHCTLKQALPLGRVTIRSGFPGHVLFLCLCPGVRAGFQKCPGFVRVFNPCAPDRLKIRLLSGFSTFVPDRSIDTFNRTVNLGYLLAHCQTFNSLVNTAEDRLLSVIRNSYHVLRPLFPPILTRRLGLRKRAHPFTLPLKDDKQCISRVLYRSLLPLVHP